MHAVIQSSAREFANAMKRKHEEWRTRFGAALRLGRAIDGHAAALAEGLLQRAAGECDRHDLERAISALKHEIEAAEALAHQWACFDESPSNGGTKY